MNDTSEIRRGEELNEANLREFLRAKFSGANEKIAVEQFPAGSSNLTYLVKIGAREVVLRRPPFGNAVTSAHDMRREFEVLKKLSKIYRLAPKPLVFCGDAAVIGSEFYLMERRSGLIIRGAAPKQLEDSEDLQRRVCEKFVENLAELHALDYEETGLGNTGKREGYAARQIEGWTRRYFNAKTHEHAALERVAEWLARNIPAASGAASLVHNDYKFDNVMLNPDNLLETTAILDWEMATVGEPLMDFGTTLGYWMSKTAGDELLSMPLNPRVLMENISRRELAEMYRAASGRDISNILFYYVFGAFKIAAVAQQIYFRFARGYTKDKRFARFNEFVGALGAIASGAIERGEI